MTGFGWEKKCPLWSHHHKKCLSVRITISFCSVWHSTPSHASFWKNKPPAKCKREDCRRKYFFAISFLLPCMAVATDCSEKGQWRGIKKQREKQKTWWPANAGEAPHCSIRTAWASCLPSTNGWVVSMYVAGAGSMREAFIFLQLYSSTCPSGKMCVGCLGSFLNKPNEFRRNSFPRADKAHKLRAEITALPSMRSLGVQDGEGAGKGR